METLKFPWNVKLAYIISLHKKGKTDVKENCLPVTILPNL